MSRSNVENIFSWPVIYLLNVSTTLDSLFHIKQTGRNKQEDISTDKTEVILLFKSQRYLFFKPSNYWNTAAPTYHFRPPVIFFGENKKLRTCL